MKNSRVLALLRRSMDLFYFPEHDIFVGERHIARAKAT
jgi:hypothetical protein